MGKAQFIISSQESDYWEKGSFKASPASQKIPFTFQERTRKNTPQ